MEAEIKRLARRRGGEDSDEEPGRKKAKQASALEAELAKYAKGRGANAKGKRKKKDEDDVLAALDSFRSKLQSSAVDGMDVDDPEAEGKAGEEGEVKPVGEDPGIEVDDDRGFLSHHLSFPKGNEEEVQKAEREYEVIDPRARGARAREEERERKRAQKQRDGGRGSRR
jgi:peptidyl-prolyl cis-trans isomerase SDCCAG10